MFNTVIFIFPVCYLAFPKLHKESFGFFFQVIYSFA